MTWAGTRSGTAEGSACRPPLTRSNLGVRVPPIHGLRKREASVHPVLAEIFGLDGVIVLIVIVVVLFGGSQIPKLARSLGSAQSQFKKGLEEGKSEATDTDKATSADGDGPSASKG